MSEEVEEYVSDSARELKKLYFSGIWKIKTFLHVVSPDPSAIVVVSSPTTCLTLRLLLVISINCSFII